MAAAGLSPRSRVQTLIALLPLCPMTYLKHIWETQKPFRASHSKNMLPPFHPITIFLPDLCARIYHACRRLAFPLALSSRSLLRFIEPISYVPNLIWEAAVPPQARAKARRVRRTSSSAFLFHPSIPGSRPIYLLPLQRVV